jgi:hypothetical protein
MHLRNLAGWRLGWLDGVLCVKIHSRRGWVRARSEEHRSPTHIYAQDTLNPRETVNRHRKAVQTSNTMRLPSCVYHWVACFCVIVFTPSLYLPCVWSAYVWPWCWIGVWEISLGNRWDGSIVFCASRYVPDADAWEWGQKSIEVLRASMLKTILIDEKLWTDTERQVKPQTQCDLSLMVFVITQCSLCVFTIINRRV